MSENNNYGLVFAGGGGNGAFEIGVWKALREFPEFNITAVSGSSVGALNAALFAGGDYAIAEEIWDNISNSDITALDKDNFDITTYMDFNFERKRGIWSTKSLKEIMSEDILIENLKKSNMPCFAACTYAPQNPAEHFTAWLDGNSVDYFNLQKESKKRIIKILLASSAIPVVFPEQRIGEKYYKDGDNAGSGDCMPVIPLYNIGIRRFMIVHLDRYKPMRLTPEIKLDKSAEFIHIFPPRELDDPLTILNFSSRYIRKRMKMGYHAAKKILRAKSAIHTSLNPLDNLIEKPSALHRLKKKMDCINMPLKVIDGETFWRVLAQNDRLKLEQHIATQHVRLLEKRPDGCYRIAWGSKNAIESAFDDILHL